jgi:hypothetical protein
MDCERLIEDDSPIRAAEAAGIEDENAELRQAAEAKEEHLR